MNNSRLVLIYNISPFFRIHKLYEENGLQPCVFSTFLNITRRLELKKKNDNNYSGKIIKLRIFL